MQKPSVQQALRVAALVAATVTVAAPAVASTQDKSATPTQIASADAPRIVLPTGTPGVDTE